MLATLLVPSAIYYIAYSNKGQYINAFDSTEGDINLGGGPFYSTKTKMSCAAVGKGPKIGNLPLSMTPWLRGYGALVCLPTIPLLDSNLNYGLPHTLSCVFNGGLVYLTNLMVQILNHEIINMRQKIVA